ncbi:MAG: twin-arginine translocase subunit TatC [Poseidonia sp.]|jgi:sec-independent protein translocase protein TatC
MERESLQVTVERLAQSSGGQILTSIKEGLQRSLKYYVALFLLGFVVAFPLTSEFIGWLVDEGRLPSGVEIIVISPVEFLFLQLRIAGYVGLTLVALMVVGQVAMHGLRHEAVVQRIQELDVSLPRPGPRLLAAGATSVLLMVAGLLYAWYGLIPLLLDYLTTDAQQAGLSTEWRLSNYAGFIVNLLSASAIGFQAPLLTTLVLRSGLATHQQLAASRRIIWFGAFVLGAFMSPPDPLSLFLVAMPIILLFEVAMLVDRITRN